MEAKRFSRFRDFRIEAGVDPEADGVTVERVRYCVWTGPYKNSYADALKSDWTIRVKKVIGNFDIVLMVLKEAYGRAKDGR